MRLERLFIDDKGQLRFPVLNAKQKTELKRTLTSAIAKFILLFGGARSGKTYLVMQYMVNRMELYPGCAQIVFRKTYKTARQTIWRETFEPTLKDLERAGRGRLYKSPAYFVHKNGSVIICAGMQPHELDAALGQEFATIYVSECSEVKWSPVEQLMTRLNSSATHVSKMIEDDNGTMVPKPIDCKLILDLNPPGKTHWSFKVFFLGQNPESKEPIEKKHLYAKAHFKPQDNAENLTKGYIEDTLGSLSPKKQLRFLLGEYGSTDGMIFAEFSPDIHIIHTDKPWRPDPKRSYTHYRTIDFGVVHPTACLLAAYDHHDEVLYVYNEYAHSYRDSFENAEFILDMSMQSVPDKDKFNDRTSQLAVTNRMFKTLVDHQSEYRNNYHKFGIMTEPARKSVEDSIDTINVWLNPGNGRKVRIQIDSHCTRLIDEMESYKRQKNVHDEEQEKPVKENDDLVDCLRYMANDIQKPGLTWK